MFQHLAATSSLGLIASAAWAGSLVLAIGFLLWLAGSRFSQGLVTLLAVAIGASVGKHLPAWMGWSIDPIGTCFGGALILGFVGYLYYRMWVGVGLGLLLAGWTAIAIWSLFHNTDAWAFPAITSLDLSVLTKSLWDSIPPDLQRILPWSIGVAGFAGMTLAALAPRLAERMFYSMLGLSVAVAAVTLMNQTINWNRLIPNGPIARLVVAAVLVLMGMTLQSWLGPKRAAALAPVPDDIPSDEPDA